MDAGGEDLLTTGEAAELLGVHPTAVSRMARAGRLAVARRELHAFGGGVRAWANLYRRADVLAAPGRRGRPSGPPCRHCGRVPSNRPRGLCWACYYNPAVLALYPITSGYARRGVGNGNRAAPPPAEPTAALPSTPEKVAVLAARAAAGEALWHPLDRTGAEDARAGGWGVRKAVRA